MSSFEEFVGKTLGLNVRPGEELPRISTLPQFIYKDYILRETLIEELKFVVAIPAEGVERGAAGFKNHSNVIARAYDCPVILELKEVSPPQRRRLIEVQQDFVVPGDQLYSPELGAYLREKRKNKPSTVLGVSAQLIFIFMLYHPGERITSVELYRELGLSRMGASRAGQELEQAGLIERIAEGITLRLQLMDTPRVAFENARPYLRSPVKRRIAASSFGPEVPYYISAGLEALAARSALAPPKYMVRATLDKASFIDAAAPVPDDPDTLELWTYNPAILACGDVVDPLSLALSIEDMDDPRVEGAVDEMLEKLWTKGYKGEQGNARN